MKNLQRIKRAWCMYDWANSTYLLVITSTIFPIYFNGVTRSFFGGETVLFFGSEMTNTVLYSYSVSAAFLIVALISPFLSGVADSGGMRLFFLKCFTFLGSAATFSLFWFRGNNVEYGIIMSVLAGIGYSGSLVFYNAFLPEITSKDQYDQLSAKGYAYGYVGSVILLLISFLIIEFYEGFGFEEKSAAVRLSFLMVGVWWFSFAQYSFYHLPKDRPVSINGTGWLRRGNIEVVKVFRWVRGVSVMKMYLFAFFFYSTGVQAVMHLAASFGEKELGLEAGKLIITITIIQLVAIVGAFLFAAISKRYNNGISILMMLVIWVGVCLFAYQMQEAKEFYALAVVVGLVMGGIQSMSRSTFSKLIPENSIDNTSFFSFYDVVEKLSIVFGTFSFGFIESMTGSMRDSTLVLACYFVIGILLLWFSGMLRNQIYHRHAQD
ncbi:MFS transporter permease [Reichenbachiella sp. 5M10]|uniref:MFS transporter n=1 Tax=Reichenbachiella sp. 5M10 TaxID=1889772 RepID=UPI000C62418C|nr:MFS transporter [Reichenbachiella sp. 5M10]PIB36140.1 MFS transporter permease [Reichenbachiella sp. 5M10]